MDEEKILREIDPVRNAMLHARDRNRRWRRQAGIRGNTSPYQVRPAPTPEHYHILYHVPSEGVMIPHYAELFMEQRDVYQRMKDMADASEPNTEYYDSGEIMIETPLHGRTGQFRVILEAARCVRRACRPNLPRAEKKRGLLLLPGADDETVKVTEVSGMEDL
jgi:hypothetical protein